MTGEKPSRYETIRVMILEMIWKLLCAVEGEGIAKLLTINWLFSFIRSDMDNMTVTMAIKILANLLTNRSNFLQQFRQIHGYKKEFFFCIRLTCCFFFCRFHLLADIVPYFATCVEIYFIFFSITLGMPISMTNYADLEYFNVFKVSDSFLE